LTGAPSPARGKSASAPERVGDDVAARQQGINLLQHLVGQFLRFPHVVHYRSVIHLSYPVDVSGIKLTPGEKFVASCFPLRSGKASGRRDLCHINGENDVSRKNVFDEITECAQNGRKCENEGRKKEKM
jgi:hypothetical protein